MASSDMASSFFKTGCKDTGRFAYFLIVVRKTLRFIQGARGLFTLPYVVFCVLNILIATIK